MIAQFHVNLRLRNSGNYRMFRILSLYILIAPVLLLVAQEKSSALIFFDWPSASPQLSSAITQTFSAAELKDGTAAKSHLSSVFFVIDSPSKPTLIIDGVQGPDLQLFPSTTLWYAVAQIPKQGTIHSFFTSSKASVLEDRPICPFSVRWPIWNLHPSGTLLASTSAHQQNLRRITDHVLDIYSRAVRSENSRGAHGRSGRTVLH